MSRFNCCIAKTFPVALVVAAVAFAAASASAHTQVASIPTVSRLAGEGETTLSRDDDDGDRDGDRDRDRWDDDDDRGGDDDDDADADSDSDRSFKSIPRDARLVAEGKGRISYRARRDGRVYVYDRKLDKVVYRGQLDEGEEIAVDPDKNRVQIEGQTVKDKIMKKKNEHRIYFYRDSGRRR